MKDLWVPLSGAIAQQRQIETIANNVANANTTGFKKDSLVFKEYLSALDKGHNEIDLPNKEFAPSDFYKSYGAENSFVKVDGNYTDFTQGPLQSTSNPFDFGIQGEGFFEVLTPNGVRFTRKGAFSLNRDSILVNSDGFPVLSKFDRQADAAVPGPENRVLKIEGGKISVNMEGDIFINDVKSNTLSVIEFKDRSALLKEGSSNFINKYPDNIKSEDISSTVNQGFLESSNVNPIAEMSNLIKAHRHFESIQKAIKTYDTISSRAVNEITKF